MNVAMNRQFHKVRGIIKELMNLQVLKKDLISWSSVINSYFINNFLAFRVCVINAWPETVRFTCTVRSTEPFNQ